MVNKHFLIIRQSTNSALTDKPWQPKGAVFKRLGSVSAQSLLHLIGLRPRDHLLRLFVTAQNSPKDSLQILRLSRVVPVRPEIFVAELYCAFKLLWVRERERYQGALDGQCADREARRSILQDGHVELFRQALALRIDPLVFVCMTLEVRVDSGKSENKT